MPQLSHSKTDLLLFDIDGTLITSGGAGVQALGRTVRDLFGVENGLDGIEIAGRTDKFITQALFKKFSVEHTPEREQELLGLYLNYLREQLPLTSGCLLPGVKALLDALKEIPSVSLALLTGNLEAGAALKLRYYGLWDYFEFGAYADDSADRNCLGPIAQKRAYERYQTHFAPERTFILGDTPHDITCGKVISVKTVGVATGGYTLDELEAHEPDFLFADFSDYGAVIEKLIR